MQIRTAQRHTNTLGDTQNAVNQMWIWGFFFKQERIRISLSTSVGETMGCYQLCSPEFLQHRLLRHPFVPEVPNFGSI